MKNIIKQSILVVSILLQTAGIFGNDFSAFPPHKKPGDGYEKSRRSKTIKMSRDDFYDIKRTMHAGRNYYISVEGRNKLGNVQFRVRNVETNEILYDNSAFGFSEEVILYNDVKQKVVIEIITMPRYFKECKEMKVKLYFANKKMKDYENFDYYNATDLYVVK